MSGQPAWAEATLRRATEAAAGRLGAPVSAHWKAIRSYAKQLVIALPGAIGLASLLCGLPFAALSGLGVGAAAFLGAIGVVTIALAFGLAVLTRPKVPAGAVVFEHGFVHVDNDTIRVVPYTDVDHVVYRVVEVIRRSAAQRRIRHEITVAVGGQPSIFMDDLYVGAGDLAQRIVTAVTQLKLPQVIQQIQSGHTVEFSPFVVDAHGIRDQNLDSYLPWSQVKELKVDRGILVVKKDGRWFSWSKQEIGSVPNFYVLLAVAQALSAAARPAHIDG